MRDFKKLGNYKDSAKIRKELAEKIADEFGIKVDKKKISCEDIKQFGTYEFEVKLYTGISAKLFVMVGE